MPEATTIWAAQDHAMALLTARRASDGSALAHVTLTLGKPGRVEEDHVWVSGEVPEWSRDPDATYLDRETYQLLVHVYSQLATQDYDDVRRRLRPMVEEVFAALEPVLWLGAADGAITTARVRGGQVEEEIIREQPMTRAMLATIRVEPVGLVDQPLG